MIRPAALLCGAASIAAALTSIDAWAKPATPPEERLTAPPPAGGRAGQRPVTAPRLEPRSRAVFSEKRPEGLLGPGELGLARLDDGSYLYVDPGHRFTLLLLPDGTARFADRWRKPSRKKPQRGKCCARPPEGFLRGANPFSGITVPGPLEWTMRAAGQDPTRAAKAEILRDTRQFRIQLAAAWYRNLIKARLRALQGELLEIWTRRDLPWLQRRALIFARWDECRERTADESRSLQGVDAARQHAAERARRVVENFVRLHAPKGSRRAYSTRELKRLNARRASAPSFQPYGARTAKTR